jgi:peptide/nickel transport system substrate-binding protein
VLRMRRNRIVALAAVAAAGIVLAGCTPGTDEPAEDVETLWVEAIQEDPMSLNAQLTSAASTQRLSQAMLEPLIGISYDYELFPMLASEYELSDDGLELTLTIREGVTWHDGEPFTVDDVLFNFQETMPLSTYGPALVSRIASVEATGDTTVVVTLSEPYGPILETLALQMMLPQHVYEGTDYVTNPANMAPIGTGPMMFESFSSGQELVLVKNEDYWRGEVQVDKAIYPIMSDPNTRTLSLGSGEIDQAEVPPAQRSQIDGNPALEQLTKGYFPQAVVLEMNASNQYLADRDVRAAVFSAIDRQAITDVALGGLGTPAEGFFPAELTWAVDEDVNFSEDFPYDVDQINDDLDDAGYPVGADGFRFTLNVKYISNLTDTQATGEQLKSMLADVGINVVLEGVTSAVFTEQVYTQSSFDLALLRTTAGADPSLGIVRWYECNPNKTAARNPSTICDDEITAAAQGATSTTVREERAEYFSDLQQRAGELIFFAPIAWTNASFPTVNTARWDGLTEPAEDTVSTSMNWLTMTWKG